MSGRAGLNRPGYLEAVSCRWCDAHRHGEPVADTQRTETARRRLVVSCGQRSGGSVLVGLGPGHPSHGCGPAPEANPGKRRRRSSEVAPRWGGHLACATTRQSGAGPAGVTPSSRGGISGNGRGDRRDLVEGRQRRRRPRAGTRRGHRTSRRHPLNWVTRTRACSHPCSP